MTYFRPQVLQGTRLVSPWATDQRPWEVRLLVGNSFLSIRRAIYETTKRCPPGDVAKRLHSGPGPYASVRGPRCARGYDERPSAYLLRGVSVKGLTQKCESRPTQ